MFLFNLFTFQQVFLRSLKLSQSFVADVPVFLEHVTGIKFKMSEYLQKKKPNKVHQFEHRIACLWSVIK